MILIIPFVGCEEDNPNSEEESSIITHTIFAGNFYYDPPNITINQGEEIKKDAFGHVRLDELNPGKWFAKEFSRRLKANKVLIQKSGYFSRSAKANKKDLELIFKCAEKAVSSAIKKQNGVVGLDENNNNELLCIEFNRIKGEKPFNIKTPWFLNMMDEIKKT